MNRPQKHQFYDKEMVQYASQMVGLWFGFTTVWLTFMAVYQINDASNRFFLTGLHIP